MKLKFTVLARTLLETPQPPLMVRKLVVNVPWASLLLDLNKPL